MQHMVGTLTGAPVLAAIHGHCSSWVESGWSHTHRRCFPRERATRGWPAALWSQPGTCHWGKTLRGRVQGKHGKGRPYLRAWSPGAQPSASMTVHQAASCALWSTATARGSLHFRC